MSPRLKSVLVQAGSFVLGGGLLWLALRNVAFGEVWAALETANWWYLLPMAVLTLLSHAIRAWRWQMLLEALPEAEDDEPVGFRPAFYSVMIGYMVNYAAPRLGEVARAGNLAAQTPLPFSGVLGTVFIERVLDVLTLAVGAVAALAFAADDLARLATLFEPAVALVRDPPLAWWALGGIAVAVAVGVTVLFRAVLRWAARREGVAERVAATLRSFRDGVLSLLRARRRLGLVGSTVAIWACYLVLTYLPLPLLGIEGLSLADAWVLLIVGAAALIVPTPGGAGSYHYAAIQTLTTLFAVGLAAATAYAVIAHAAQLVLYTAAGFACLLLQGRGLSAWRPTERPA